MRSFPKLVAIGVCAVIFGGSAFAAKKEEKPADGKKKDAKEKTEPKKKDKDKDKSKDSKDKPDGEPQKGKLSLPILKDHDAFGLKIPYFNNDGKLQMVFNIGRASRLDQDRVSMAEMQLETYDEEGKPEMTIDLPVSELNLSTNIISTETSVTIKRSDFEITGHSMEFNTETRQGKLAGNVRMLIYDLNQETAQPDKDQTTTQ
jgi:hypothetical protein